MDVDYSRGGISQGLEDNAKILANKKARWEQSPQQGAAEAFAQSLGPDGQPDEGRYYARIKERGISPSLATGYRVWVLAQSGAQKGLAIDREVQTGLGYTPDAPNASTTLQSREQFINPQPGSTDLGGSQLKAPSAGDFFQRMSGRANPMATQQRAPAKIKSEQSAAPSTAGGSGYSASGASVSGEDGGRASGGAMVASDPRALEGMGMEPQPQYGQIQGFLATHKPGQQGAQAVTPDALMQQDSQLFAWSPQDEATASRKYGTALSSMMQAMGKEPGQFLQETYTTAFNSMVPPEPNRALMQMGNEGMVKYRQQEAEYRAGLQKAQAAGRKAVMDARHGLLGTAKEYGEVSKADERHEGDMGGRRKGAASGDIFRTRAVSPEEKALGDRIGDAYLDLKSSKSRGGFEGDYSAAMARAKADGNVNEDAIVGHLVSMGAGPSDKAVALKNLMREAPGAPIGDIYKMAKL